MADEGTMTWAAHQVVRQHEEPASPDRATGRCAQCQPGGWCDLLHWARLTVLAEGLPHPHG